MTGGDSFADRASFAGASVLVCGLGLAGRTAVSALRSFGARVAVSSAGRPPADGELGDGVRFLGDLAELPSGTEVVVTSPGLPPSHPLLESAIAAGVPVLGELELAWRLRGPDPARWLVVTGTNGKTTTVHMLETMLTTAGVPALAVGNVGVPILDAVRDDAAGYEYLVVEASSFQLHFSDSLRPWAATVLNLAEDHLDWHGSMQAYAADKAKVFAARTVVVDLDEPAVLHRVPETAARVDVTLAPPPAGAWGVQDGWMVSPSGDQVIAVAQIRPPGAHNVANALSAAALAGTAGLDSAAVAAGLRAFVPGRHRNELVATVAGVDFVDDSKATNPHAARGSLTAYPSVVWVAGGQLKGASIDELVVAVADRLRAVVLLGVDRDLIRAALARHAPDVPVTSIDRTDDGAMSAVVSAAAASAVAGDVVLLAPAAASKDMFTGYDVRGDAFAAAARHLPGAAG